MLPPVYLWDKAPFLRLLPCLITGILLQWHLSFGSGYLILFSICIGSCYLLYFFLPLQVKFRIKITGGILHHLLLICSGGLLVHHNDVRNHKDWIGHLSQDSCAVVVCLQEDAVEKTASYKSLASVKKIIRKGGLEEVSGKVIIYFSRDSSLRDKLKYGSILVFRRPLQKIKNTGNPGSFDYARYCLFNGISHQVYLTRDDFVRPDIEEKNLLTIFLIQTRKWIINTIRTNLPGKKEQGLAEALLIGYKDDLDKDLVQAYSDTGVVHVIAISGLHLGLIYWLLLLVTKPLRSKKTRLLRFLVIAAGLWIFSLLAGAQPSVLRSAVMFSFLAAGNAIARRTSVYNTLALSAFALLCYNPFWLWDAGFQLSYSAVLSIIVFYRPVYNSVYLAYKIPDAIWKLIAVTLSAQILTLPFSLYHFHQFPLLFLFTNLVAVPLSSFILIGELMVCCLFFLPSLSGLAGAFLSWCIWLMNSYVEWMNQIPYAVWEGISISPLQGVLLALLISCAGHWIIQKKRSSLVLMLLFLFGFSSLRTSSFRKASDQFKLIVYQVPKSTAVEIYSGRTSYHLGDSAVFHSPFIYHFHIEPSRVMHRISENHYVAAKAFRMAGTYIRIVDSTVQLSPQPDSTGYLVLAGNLKTSISLISKYYHPLQLIASSSVPAWKATRWKKEADSLKIPFHDVLEKGAFVVSPEALPLRPR